MKCDKCDGSGEIKKCKKCSNAFPASYEYGEDGDLCPDCIIVVYGDEMEE